MDLGCNAKILFSVPTAGMIEAATTFAIARIVRHPFVSYVQTMGSPVDRVRNGLVRMSLQGHYSHLMMMDSDVVPPPNIVELLLECKAPMATAIVPIMLHGKLVSNILELNDDGDTEHSERFVENWEDKKEPFEVEAAGCGCVLIRCDVFERMKFPWFRYRESDAGEQFGEDLFFAERARAELHLRYMAQPKAVCGHIKKIDLLDIMRAFRMWEKHWESERVAV